MGITIGILLVIIALVILVFGDRSVGTKVGFILRIFSHNKSTTKLLKWVIGLLALWFGVSLIFSGGKL
jgi:hypothetical protein